MPDATVTLRSRSFLAALTLVVCPALTLVGAPSGPAELGAQEVRGAERVTLEGEVVDASNNLPLEGAIVSLPGLGLTWMYQTSSYDIYSVRFLGKMEGFFRYGRRGENGVLEIKTHR